MSERHARGRGVFAYRALMLMAATAGSLLLLTLPVTQSAFTGSTSNLPNTFSAAATFPTYSQAVLADAPLSYWRLSESSATTAADASGNSNNATYMGNAQAFQVAGSPAGGSGTSADTAVELPGYNRVIASSSATMSNPNPFTEEVWFKTASTVDQIFMDFGDKELGRSTVGDRYMKIFADGAVQFGVGVGGTVSTITSSPGFNNGAWHLATASLGPGGMKLYVDGTVIGTKTPVTTSTDFVGYWRIGGDDAYYFSGRLDEAAVYTSQLSDARVNAHYTSGSSSPSLSSYTGVVAADNPWSLWHLNDPPLSSYAGGGYDTPLADASGNNHGGFYHSLPPVGLVVGGAGALVGAEAGNTALRLQGTGYVAGLTSQTNPTLFTLELWFRTSSTRGGQLIDFANKRTGVSSSYSRIAFMLNSGQIAFGLSSSPQIISPAAYNDGGWHHLAISATPTLVAMYVDAKLVVSTTSPGSNQNYTGYWRVGGDNLGGWPNAPTSSFIVDGDIDEVAVYPTSLNSQQVAFHFHANH